MIHSNTFKQLSKRLSEIDGSFAVAMEGMVSIYFTKNIEFNLPEELEKIKNQHDKNFN